MSWPAAATAEGSGPVMGVSVLDDSLVCLGCSAQRRMRSGRRRRPGEVGLVWSGVADFVEQAVLTKLGKCCGGVGEWLLKFAGL